MYRGYFFFSFYYLFTDMLSTDVYRPVDTHTVLFTPSVFQTLCVDCGIHFPIGAGADKYACLLQNQLTRVHPGLKPFPTPQKRECVSGCKRIFWPVGMGYILHWTWII